MVHASHRHCSHIGICLGVLEGTEMNKQPEALFCADLLDTMTVCEFGARSAKELRRLHAIEEAAKNLVKVKGRFHTEQAFNQLKELLK